MSTPQNPKPKPRRTRQQKNENLLPDSGRQNALSDSDAYRPSVSHAQSDNDKGRHPRRNNGNKKHGGLTEDEFDHANSRRVSTTQQESTPVKQAYAGALFQQSPAASTLPLPSFYSKSVPNSALSKKMPLVAGNDEAPTGRDSSTPMVEHKAPVDRESTPLDFLFNAARNAKTPTREDSPSMSGANTPSRDSPAPRDGDGMFAFELDGAPGPGEDGSAFATPYKDRMESLKSTRPIGERPRTMDEAERKAKSEELKRFLLKSQVQQNMQAMSEADNPFNARPALPILHRQRSNPTVPQTQDNHYANLRPDPRPDPTNFNFPQYQSQPQRPPSSNLRNVYGPIMYDETSMPAVGAASPGLISTARKDSRPVSQSNTNGVTDVRPDSDAPPANRQRYSSQQMEDDIRRILKLNMSGNT